MRVQEGEDLTICITLKNRIPRGIVQVQNPEIKTLHMSEWEKRRSIRAKVMNGFSAVGVRQRGAGTEQLRDPVLSGN